MTIYPVQPLPLCRYFPITWFTITSRSQSPRALFQTLQPFNSIIPPQYKKIYRFLYRSLLQRSLQPLDKFIYCAQPCRTSYNTANPINRPIYHPFQPTFYLTIVVRPPSTQLNPMHPIQRVPLQPVTCVFLILRYFTKASFALRRIRTSSHTKIIS